MLKVIRLNQLVRGSNIAILILSIAWLLAGCSVVASAPIPTPTLAPSQTATPTSTTTPTPSPIPTETPIPTPLGGGSGTILYFQGPVLYREDALTGEREVVIPASWMQERFGIEDFKRSYPSFSPDLKRFVLPVCEKNFCFDFTESGRLLYASVDMTESEVVRLPELTYNYDLLWAPDGNAILFGYEEMLVSGTTVDHGRSTPLYVLPIGEDGPGAYYQIGTGDVWAWFPDGDQVIAFSEEIHASPRVRVFLINTSQGGINLCEACTEFMGTTVNRIRFTPNGEYMLVSSDSGLDVFSAGLEHLVRYRTGTTWLGAIAPNNRLIAYANPWRGVTGYIDIESATVKTIPYKEILGFDDYWRFQPCAWSPDSNIILFVHTDRNSKTSLIVLYDVTEKKNLAFREYEGYISCPVWETGP